MPGCGVGRYGLYLHALEDAQSRQACLGAVHVPHREKLILAEGYGRGNHVGAYVLRTHHGEKPLGGLQRVRIAGIAGGAAVEQCVDPAGAPLPLGQLGQVAGQGEFEGDGAGMDGAVGQELDVFGAEEVEATVAQAVGEVHAYGLQGVDAEDGAGLEILVFSRYGVNEESGGVVDVTEVDDGVDEVWLAGVDVVGDAGLARVALVGSDGVGGRGVEEAGVVESGLEHSYANFGADVADEHRLGHQLAVEPPFQALGRIVPVVVDPQADGEGGADVGRDERVVGLDVDDLFKLALEVAWQADAVAGSADGELADAGVEHLALAQAAGGGAAHGAQQ